LGIARRREPHPAPPRPGPRRRGTRILAAGQRLVTEAAAACGARDDSPGSRRSELRKLAKLSGPQAIPATERGANHDGST